MEKVKVLDSNGVQTRVLTRQETRKLDKLQLPYEVKSFISKVWASKTTPIVKRNSLKTNVVGVLITLINVLLPVVLWLLFLDPEGSSIQPYVGEKAAIYMEGVRRLGMFILWIVIIFVFAWGLTYFPLVGSIEKDENEVWQPVFLNGFEKRNVIRKNFFSLVALAIVLGLIVNSYYVTTVFYLIAIAVFYGIQNGLKKNVREQIKKQIGIEI
jgi:hypothetical protein